MEIDNKKLIKWIYFIPIISVILTIVITVAILVSKEKSIYNHNLEAYKNNLLKMKKDEVKDRLDKLVEQIRINKEVVIDNYKNGVKNIVDLAYKIIEKTYNNNKHLSKDKIVQKIKEKLEGVRFFDNLSGYFYMYYLDGTCIMLPTNPDLEGKNLLNIKDAKGTYIIKKAIRELKKSDRVFDSWYWYRPDSKKMEKKIGYFRSFKPLNIFIGSAFYLNDAIEKSKKIALKIIRSYKFGKHGYIFAYDYSGVTLSHIKKNLIGKNRLNLLVDNRYVVRESIEGAKKRPEGFFYYHVSSYNPYKKYSATKISYIRGLPEFQWFLGTGFYKHDVEKIANLQKNYFKEELENLIRNIFIASFFIILIISAIMILIAKKIENIIQNYKKSINAKQEEIIKHKRKFELLFERSKDAIMLTDGKNIVDANESCGKLFGVESEEKFLSLKFIELSPLYQPDGSVSKESIKKITDVVRDKGVYRGEWLCKRVDNDKEFWAEIVTTFIEIDNKEIFHIVLRDITRRKNAERRLIDSKKELSFRARHDMLTDLPNRYMFKEVISHEMAKAIRNKEKLAAIFIDLDNFKDINDLYGHEIGDKLLKEVSKKIQSKLRDGDYIFRFGGDEFVVLISEIKYETVIANIIDKVKENFKSAIDINGHSMKVGLSVGVALFPTDAKNQEELIRNADIAMYRAKSKGKNRVEFFKEDMFEKIKKYHHIETELRTALKEDQFELYYQPKINAKTKEIVGMEALIRWIKDGKIVPPGEFIDVAKKSDIIVDIGEVVIDKAFKYATELKSQNLLNGKISINIDDRQLKNGNLVKTLKKYLKKHNCDSSLMELEITEGFIMSDIENSVKLLKELKELGFSISIDDFGTGYSSLAYIKILPFDVLKIDKSFVDDVPGLYEDEAIVKTIIELAKGLKLEIVAEGIEEDKQENFLVDLGCCIIQGYKYSKPLSQNDIAKFISRSSK